MPKFQLAVEFSGHGYIDVEAADANAARVRVRRMEPKVEWRGIDWDVDTTLCDEDLDLKIGRVAPVEQE